MRNAGRRALGWLLCLGILACALALASAPALAAPGHLYHSTFGEAGPGPGQLEQPGSVAVEEVALGHVGAVYVADTGNNRVEWFSPEGVKVEGSFDGHATPAGGFGSIDDIAVDNSEDPLDLSAGDVYVLDRANDVVDKFSANGEWIATIGEGAAGEPLEGAAAITVDREGRLFVYESKGRIIGYDASLDNGYMSQTVATPAASAIAVDGEGNFYLDLVNGEIEKVNAAGETLVKELIGTSPTENPTLNAVALALDQASSEVYAVETVSFAGFESARNRLEVGVFGKIAGCTATAPCDFAPPGTMQERFGKRQLRPPAPASIAVDAHTNTVYVTEAHLNQVLVFTPTLTPVVEGEAIATVGSRDARLTAEIGTHATASSYQIEYGTTAGYGENTAAVPASPQADPFAVNVRVGGLQPETSYHARLVATNEHGTSYGPDLAFTTSGTGETTLPDGRAYELVSPNAATDANVYVRGTSANTRPDVRSINPARASADGDAVTYSAEAQPTGGAGSTGEGRGDQFRAARGPTGWTATDIMPHRAQYRAYQGFSGDLALGMASTYTQPPLTPEAPANCEVLYSWSATSEAFHATFTTLKTPGVCGSPVYAGISGDDTHVIFQTSAAVTANALEGGGGDNLYEEPVGGAPVLVSVLPDGQPVANATFGVGEGFPGWTEQGEEGSDFDRVISTDGSRLVWTDLDTSLGPENPQGTTRLFLRENPEGPNPKTVQVDGAVGGGGQYWGASDDDAYIFFTKNEDLYRFDVETQTTSDLIPTGGVAGVVGVSHDGAIVYFVAKPVLSTKPNSAGEKAATETCSAGNPPSEEELQGVMGPGRGCNLYALRVGESPRFVAILMAEDNQSPRDIASNSSDGDWRGAQALRTAELSHDGQTIAFRSARNLTGYVANGEREIFVYDLASEALLCASCNPTGEPAKRGDVFQEEGVNYTELSETHVPVEAAGTEQVPYQPRWISANGGRIFFDTRSSLVAADTNNLEDVYEWERNNEGSCHRVAGCIYLLSGTGTGESYLLDASENGDDVFFTSRTDLVPDDRGENVVLYDARVGGGFSQASQACTGTGCQGVPPAAPAFATPPSVTFSGTGNFSSPGPKRSVKPKTAATIRAQRLARALRACRTKRNRGKRASCEKRARKRFGPTPKAKRSAYTSRTPSQKRRIKP
jgi:hypothetical protein